MNTFKNSKTMTEKEKWIQNYYKRYIKRYGSVVGEKKLAEQAAAKFDIR